MTFEEWFDEERANGNGDTDYASALFAWYAAQKAERDHYHLGWA